MTAGEVVLPRGVLRPPPDGAWALRRWAPGPTSAPYVAWLWAVEWDLRGRAPHAQATLPHPSAHLVVEDDVVTLHGPPRRRFERRLAGAGRVVAIRFRPGGVRPLLGAPVASIVDRSLPASALAGLDGGVLAASLSRSADLDSAARELEAAVVALLPAETDPAIALADRAVALVAEDRAIRRTADLAARLALSSRSLQRLFAEWVGVGAAWVIRRYRVQEAAARALAGDPVDWARLAAELGYCDQAHLVREFTATVGVSPARYAAGAGG